MKKLLALLLVLGVVLMNACQKENSFESGGDPAQGLLQSDVNGDCFPKTVFGTYIKGTALNSGTNYIAVDVLVTTAGSYTIYSDTVNGVYFRLTGLFTAAGNATVNLKGYGTPAAEGTFNFTIQFDGQVCSVPVTFLPTGAGGPAVFTLNSTAGSCTGATPAGSYAVGVALNSSNTVPLSINVTTIGTYTITATTGGMTFSATGTFAAPGAQTVTLLGSGTPTTAGANTFPLTAGSSSCSFIVTVGNASVGTLGGQPGACTPFTVNGTYSAGVVLSGTNTIQIQANVTTAGVYSITTNTVNGMTFSASGTFAVTGVQPVTLTGTGTPTAAGTFSFTVTYGSSTCTLSVTVGAAVIDYFPRTVNSNWSYEFDDVFDDSLLSKVISPTHSALGNTYNIFMGTIDPTTTDTFGYFRKNAGQYFRYTNLADYLSFDDDQYVEFIFIKDDQATGHVWYTPGYNGTLGGTAVQIRIKFTILQKDVPVTVQGVTYQNTIVVEEKYEANVGGVWTSLDTVFGYYKDYYSRNIGWIKDEYFDGSGSTPTGVMEVRRYVVF